MKVTLEVKDNKLVMGIPDGHKSEDYVEFFKAINGGSAMAQISIAIKEQAHKELDKLFDKAWK